VRADAVRTAADSKEAWSFDVLPTALEDYDPEVSAEAAWALGELRDPFAAVALMQLLDDPDLNVRVAAARALGAVGDVSAVPLLQELVADPAADQWLRSVARESLVALGHGPPDAKPAGLLVWALGLALVAAGVGAATAWGVLGVIPFIAGLGLLLLYQAGQMRRAAREGWKWYEGGFIGGDGAGGG
jgi:HEAT repeat protein